LSPTRILALIVLLVDRVRQGCQFVIATHSPILMAYPGATIVSFDEVPAAVVQYGELESVRLVREFLVEPQRYLSRITATS